VEYTEASLDGFDFLFAILIMIRSNEESQTKSRRLKAAWVGKRLKAKDRPLTGSVPGWLTLNNENGRKLELVEDRAVIVRRIVREALKGKGKLSIAADLNREGVKPFGSASMWHRSYIDKILTSPALAGRLIPHTESYNAEGKMMRTPEPAVENYYPALIDEDTWQHLQSKVKRSPLRGRHAHGQVLNVLSTMTRIMKGVRSEPKLLCSRAKVGGGCAYVSVSMEAVERTIIERYREILDGAPTPDASAGRALEDAEHALSELEGQLSGMLDVLQRKPSDALAARIGELEGHVREARAVREAAYTASRQSESKLNAAKLTELGLAVRAKPANLGRINAALRALVSSVTVDHSFGMLQFQWHLGGQTEVFYSWPVSAATTA
jgi:hypothetical protein